MSEQIESAVADYIRAKRSADAPAQDRIKALLALDGILIEDVGDGVTWRRQQYDLIRHNTTGELFLTDQLKSGELIAQNPLFSIVGIGLSREATDTPYGKIGAVLE